MSEQPIVVVGAGQAGVQFAISFREANPSTPVVLVGAEAGEPYQRPQLSKEFITKPEEPKPLMLRTRRALVEREIDYRDGREVTSVDPRSKIVRLRDGAAIGYSKLVLATGSRNRVLPVPGIDWAGVCSLRTLGEARAIRHGLESGNRVVIVGAGFIGLELAAAARLRGCHVTVIDVADRPMARMLSVPMSRCFQEAHSRAGIDFRFGQGVQHFSGRNSRVEAVVTDDGTRLAADLVIVAVGIQPNVEIAEGAGLEVNNGIVVDGRLRTNAPDIWALGDCARYPHPMAQSLVRLESVQNAADQAKYLGRNLLDNAAQPYADLPWFWSYQGALKLRIAGLVMNPDEVVLRGDPADRKFSVFCFRCGRLQGVESLNMTADHMIARRLLAAGERLALSGAEIADPQFDLKQYSQELQAATGAAGR